MIRARIAGSRTTIDWVDWDQISVNLPIAVVASEDQDFPLHRGFDFDSIEKAVRDRDQRVRGASTITQQVAKNLYLWPERSWIRKGLEAYLTIFIEILWPKHRNSRDLSEYSSVRTRHLWRRRGCTELILRYPPSS